MKKKITGHDSQILNADKEYASAVSLFESAKAKVDAANEALNETDLDIDEQVKALLAKKETVKAQKERNAKFATKLGEFLG